MLVKIGFLFFLGLLPICAIQAQRVRVNMDEGWQFRKGDTVGAWQSVRLPHTWNVADVMDDEPGYYRGAGWYRKVFRVPANMRNRRLSLCFEGANQQTDVFINGRRAAAHTGGYTGFTLPIDSLLHPNGDNVLLVKVDNSFNAGIAPLSADFTFYGGLYRDVFLVATGPAYFGDAAYGSEGVYITTPRVTAGEATVHVRSLVNGPAGASVQVVSTLYDPDGRLVTTATRSVRIRSSTVVDQDLTQIARPHLWSPEDPARYTLRTEIRNSKGQVTDAVTNTVGFRWFRFSADSGFFLNGHPLKLVGASRHQDYQGLGNAVPDSLAVRDVVLLKNMGANFLRVAHYPQDPCVLAACDSLGLIASVEIPVVNEITESDTFYNNCLQAQAEMIRQSYNHPSVVMWCYMNEILLRPHFNGDKERQQTYFANINRLAHRLDSLTRREDPSRYTMMADHGNYNQYRNTGLLEIPMVVGWNLYSGWYGGNLEEFGCFLDDFHKNHPNTPFLVTEYGADADPRIRSSTPVRFDKSVEYTTRFHQYYLGEMMKRPYVAGAVVWNLADFNSETRTETMPHINNKGLLEWDRKPKDPYYFYQASLLKEPFIKVLGSCQGGFAVADSAASGCHRLVQVASNLDSVTLIINGEAQPKMAVTDHLYATSLPFRNGLNTLVAYGLRDGRRYSDSICTVVDLQPYSLRDTGIAFRGMNVLLGANRTFTDSAGAWWQPDQTYRPGYWGSVGGKRFRLNNGRLPYGTDKDILGTPDDPVYQTQLTGIRQYRLDVPPGRYRLTLHFAELLGGTVQLPPYNLADDERRESANRRIFNVRVNGQPFLYHFDMADEYGPARAVARTTTIVVNDREGIFIDFEPVEGEPVLNALQLKKISADEGR